MEILLIMEYQGPSTAPGMQNLYNKYLSTHQNRRDLLLTERAVQGCIFSQGECQTPATLTRGSLDQNDQEHICNSEK